MPEQPIRGPERAYYQRLRGDYTVVASNGALTLTTSTVAFVANVVFRIRFGRDVTVALSEITDVRAQKLQRGYRYGADGRLVVTTKVGEIGFLLKDPEGWADAVRGQISASQGV